jgi:DNA repair protein RadC
MAKPKGVYHEALAALQLPTWLKIERKLSAFDKRAAAGAVLKCGNGFDIWRFAQSILKVEDVEVMLVFCLDGTGNIKHIGQASRGGPHGVVISVADLLRYPIISGSKSFILAHNHPSGDPTPSGADIALTKKVAEAAKLMNLELMDHVVVAHDRHASMLELGYIE